MAKINNKVETPEQMIARLQAELVAAQDLRKKAQDEQNNAIADKVRKLTAEFGVPTLADVISLIKQVEKGTLGKLDATARPYVKLTDEQKVAIKARLTKGEQVSTLANEFGVSGGTIYNLKKEPVAVPAVAATAAGA